jgi:hypothetical protein
MRQRTRASTKIQARRLAARVVLAVPARAQLAQAGPLLAAAVAELGLALQVARGVLPLAAATKLALVAAVRAHP